MTEAQWGQVRDLFEQAADVPPGELTAWLSARSADQAVVDEVRSLLTVESRAGDFLSEPVLGRVADLLHDEGARFAAGDVLGAYRVVRELGRGGMGHVYLAVDSRLGRQVALKVLAPRFVMDAAQRERLRREARAAAALAHRGICTVYALEEVDNEVVIATEFVDGETLRQEMDTGRLPSPERLMQTARELAAALAAAHAAGITHRDLKPENVIRASDGSVKILDFGLALRGPADDLAEVAPRVTTPGTLVGTPLYMAPEQIEGNPVDARTDLWALGALLFEYASGVHPFAATTPLALAARILEGAPDSLSSLRSDVPAALEAVVQQCLQRTPASRPQSAAQLLASLDSGRRPAASDSVRWWRIHQWVVIAVYAVAVLVAWVVLLRSSERAADAAFVFVMVVATLGGMLRGHLLFAHRLHGRSNFMDALHQASTPLLAADSVLGAGLVVEGLWVAVADAVPGALIAGLGLGIVLTRVVLERSTTHVAFGSSVEPGTRQP